MAFAKLIVDLALKDDKFNAGLKKAGVGVKGLEKSSARLDKVIGGTLVKTFQVATAAVVAFGAASAKVGTDFQHSITLVKTLSKDGISNFKALEDEARRLGATTEFSARQSADAMINFARAGMSAREIIAATGPALMMAGGAGESMSLATMAMSASLRQFSLDASESGHVADVYTVALKNSLFNLQGLNDAMKYAGPAGAVFGMSIESTTAAVAQFRNMGLDASMAGTAFRMSLVALAKRTPAMTKVMKKYGLETKDVSLKTNTFRQVLENLAKTGIDAEDAIKMFGARAGANMGLLIQQMRDPAFVNGFDELTDSLYRSSDGAGAAKTQYEEMGKTVRRQFLIAKSAAEELLLSVFDEYKDPLMKFFAELGEVIQFTADLYKSAAGDFSSGIVGPLEQATGYLRANKEQIAAWFLEASQFIGQLIGAFRTIIPMVTKLTQAVVLLGSAFLIQKAVTALTLALSGGLVPALISATAAARALGLAMATALGPIGMVVTALGILAIGFGSFKSKVDPALKSANEFRKAMEDIKKEAQAVTKAQEDEAQALIDLMKKNKVFRISEMKDRKAGAHAIEKYTQFVDNLTAAEAAQALQKGDLVYAGEGVTRGLYTTAEAAKYLGEDVLPQLEAAQERATEGIELAKDARNRELPILNEILQNHEMLEQASRKEITLGFEQRAHLEELTAAYDAEGKSVHYARARIKELAKSLVAANQTLAGHEKAVKKTRLEIAKLGDTADKVEKNNKKRGSGGKSKAQYLEELTKLEAKLQMEFSKIGASANEIARMNLGKQIKEIEKKYDELIKKRRFRREKEALQERKENAVALAKKTEDMKKQLRDEEAAEKQHVATMKAIDDEYEKAMAAEGDVLLRRRLSNAAQVEVDMLDSLDAIKRSGIQLTAQETAEFETKYNALRYEAAKKDIQARMALEERTVLTWKERTDLRRIKFDNEYANRRDQLMLKHAGANTAMEARHAREMSVAKLTVAIDNGKKLEALQIRHAKENKRRELLASNETFGLKLEHNKKANKVEVLLGKLKLVKARDIAAKLLQTDLPDEKKKSLLFRLTGLSDEQQAEWKKKLKAAADFVGSVFVAPTKKAIGLFKEITGFSFDMGSMMTEASGKKGEMGDAAVEAESKRREDSGADAMTSEEEAAVRSEGEARFDPATAAAEVADEQAQGMMDQIQMWIDMAPILLQKLADNLPILINKFVEALPTIISGMVDAMMGPDGLIMAVINGIPKIIGAFVEQLPAIIQMVVFGLINFIKSGIPQIIEEVLTALPILVMGIANAIPMIFDAIFEMIPKVIDSFFKMLPRLIQGIVRAVLNIVVGILNAIPQIIAAIIQAIGPLIEAVLASIPLIIQEVLTAIPALIEALIMAIPYIVMALVEAIPRIIVALVGAIPLLITALGKGIGKLIVGIFVKMPAKIGKAIGRGFSRAWRKIKKSVARLGKSVAGALNPANWFGDTPGAVKIGGNPGVLGFASDDYVIAAQKPIDMLAQAMEAVRSEGGGVPQMRSRRSQQSSMMASPVPLAAAMPGGGGGDVSTNIALKVQVEGQTIDNALITSKRRGNSPKMWKEIRRMNGVTSGFDKD